MALTVRLETTGPGQGVFRILGIEAPGGTLELAIQHNSDDRYLGDGQIWQITPHWHWLPGVEAIDGELNVRAGPEIVDPVAAASNMALRILVRVHGEQISSVLRIGGHLLSSPAARPPNTAEPRLEPSTEGLGLDLELLAEPREPVPEKAGSSRGSRGLVTTLLFLVLLLGVGIGAWLLGWLDPWLVPAGEPRTALAEGPPEQGGTGEANTVSEAAQDAEAGTSPIAPAHEAVEAQSSADTPETPPIRGVELARAFLSADPKPQAIQAEAERQEQADDCDAAMVLYNHAAQADPKYALTLGRRLDPNGFEGRPCTKAPDATAASVWYQEAAAAGNTAAQRRLGQLLVARESSGPLFEDGIRWLRLAAQAGDSEAKDLLASLGKP
jgi:hypothetical protein